MVILYNIFNKIAHARARIKIAMCDIKIPVYSSSFFSLFSLNSIVMLRA